MKTTSHEYQIEVILLRRTIAEFRAKLVKLEEAAGPVISAAKMARIECCCNLEEYVEAGAEIDNLVNALEDIKRLI